MVVAAVILGLVLVGLGAAPLVKRLAVDRQHQLLQTLAAAVVVYGNKQRQDQVVLES